ncbi:MAG TPA: peptidylprolyl isomerase [Methylophilaceae bacterium]|jgi:peptidyl-prolyl cis-trans isomerase C
MKQISKTLFALAMLALLQSAQAAEPSVATVNGKPIKQSLLDFITRDATARGQKIDGNAKEIIVSKLISNELVYQEAQKAGLDKQPDYIAKEELSRRELLANTYLQDYLKKNPVSEADTKAAYDKYKAELGDKEYSARHILVATEAEAKDIIAQLSKGADFAKLAKEKSNDPGSKEKGGDLGWFSPGGMVKPFSDAVAKLQKGGVTSEPVQTQFGWHVIKLDDVRTAQPPAYDKVKDGLQKQLQQRQLEKLLTDLRAKAKIVDNSTAAKK